MPTAGTRVAADMRNPDAVRIYPKRGALPRPPEARATAEAWRLRHGRSFVDTFHAVFQRRLLLKWQLDLLDAEIDYYQELSACNNPTGGYQDVESYQEVGGISRPFVDAHELPVGQLQWLTDAELTAKFHKAGDSIGNVGELRWGSGALLAGDKFLTAGHCFTDGGGFLLPSHANGQIPIAADEAATAMQVVFGYQLDPNGHLRPGQAYPVTALLETGADVSLDYAVIQLGKNPITNRTPTQDFGALDLGSRDVGSGGILCIIQYPLSSVKKVAVGTCLDNNGGTVLYNTIETDNGSSGAPLLSVDGGIVGVHSGGYCYAGANEGAAICAIRGASKILGRCR